MRIDQLTTFGKFEFHQFFHIGFTVGFFYIDDRIDERRQFFLKVGLITHMKCFVCSELTHTRGCITSGLYECLNVRIHRASSIVEFFFKTIIDQFVDCWVFFCFNSFKVLISLLMGSRGLGPPQTRIIIHCICMDQIHFFRQITTFLKVRLAIL